MFSKACEYGIRAIIYIATQSMEGKRVKIGDIAKNSDTPVAFTAKILGLLTKNNIVLSQTGPNGGFYIELNQMNEIKLGDIVTAIDGDTIYRGCALGLKECNNEAPCPIHDKFIKVREGLRRVLDTTTVYDLAMGLKSGRSVLMR